MVELSVSSEFTRKILEEVTDGAFMEGYIEARERFSGQKVTSRQVLEGCGFTEQEIQGYFKRTGTTDEAAS